ncbi:globin domain-containing protein [Mongoliitalea daihaiensis]|uniref:globin domain-containing protein n=1 Tax=Mongoliitalea daihaiensis TaxID=2782006 RepID=UPI001F43DEAA|nr:cyanoglobin [Mongoliitalea daihaiensis]UJP64766.1 cyanoglobin [Mongoliitalea daihaiensis]
MNSNIYETLGDEKIRLLVKHFYLNVREEPTLRKLYPEEDLSGAEDRLYWFLLHVFGGPHTYLEKRGHPMLRRRHFQWQIDQHLRNSWMDCMLRAMDEVAMETDIREALMNYFVKVANHMVNS